MALCAQALGLFVLLFRANRLLVSAKRAICEIRRLRALKSQRAVQVSDIVKRGAS
jgi:hypothetical protein